jgi:RNA-binding protein
MERYMLTGKQRSHLKSMANTIKPIIQVGKEGVSENFLSQLDNMLNDHEIVKINILSNSGEQSKAVANELCEVLKAEFVSALGNKAVVYRESRTKHKDEKIVLPK